jgi:hypothetical protein
MSVQDERELRDRLSTLLDGIEPRPAPVTRVVRLGRGIRMRRRISVAAGLSVIVAGAALIPGLLQSHRVAPMAKLHYKVTVTPLGPNAKRGLIGAGTIGSKRWRVVVNRSEGDGCAPQAYLLTCGFAYSSSVGPRRVSLGSASAGSTQYELGAVGTDVTRVAIHLSNGAVLNLQPVLAGGRRWVAVAAPLRAITRAVSFVGQSEYEHAIPFDTNGMAEFVTWLGPGQTGLPVASRSVGSGEFDGVPWHAGVHTGPWGLCATYANGSACIPATSPSQLSGRLSGRIVAALTCGPLYTSSGKATGASSGVVIVPPDVKDVVLQLADGSRLRMAAIAIGGTRALGYAIPARPKVVRTLEYGVHGQLLHSASPPGWGC